MGEDRAALDRLLAALDARLAALVLRFARRMGRAVARAAGADGTIPARRRPALFATAATYMAILFGDSPADALADDGMALSPYARLLAVGIREGTALALTPTLEGIERHLSARPDLAAALRQGRPGALGAREPRGPIFDPARTWVDPNGHRLSDRIWQSGREVRAQLDALLEYHLNQGTQATQIARELEQFLTVEGRRSVTRTPYGSKGLYAPRRLARTEVTRAHGAATVEAVALNPFMAAVGWRLSGSHPETDVCDRHAGADDHGLGRGNYPPRATPGYPAHPHERCVLSPVPRQDTDRVLADLGRWARGEDVPGWGDLGAAPLDAGPLTDWLTGLPDPSGAP